MPRTTRRPRITSSCGGSSTSAEHAMQAATALLSAAIDVDRDVAIAHHNPDFAASFDAERAERDIFEIAGQRGREAARAGLARERVVDDVVEHGLVDRE